MQDTIFPEPVTKLDIEHVIEATEGRPVASDVHDICLREGSRLECERSLQYASEDGADICHSFFALGNCLLDHKQQIERRAVREDIYF